MVPIGCSTFLPPKQGVAGSIPAGGIPAGASCGEAWPERRSGCRPRPSHRAEDLGVEICRRVDLGQQMMDVRAGTFIKAPETTKTRQTEVQTRHASLLDGAELRHASRDGRVPTPRLCLDTVAIAPHDLLILLDQ